ncbi:Biopterin-dependent aromatic amino acid hydroxylase-domain-containing protein [Globomyces pollinis-pini]|nr:Biopterin-dependent aromatic amino acid hydroxylase-domain-containing protein [Globomyces pollinis-pini]
MFAKSVFRSLSLSSPNLKNQRLVFKPLALARFNSTIPDGSERASIHFTVEDKVGALEKILAMLRSFNISLTRIESRPSKSKGNYDFYVDFVATPSLLTTVIERIKLDSKEVKTVSSGTNDAGVGSVPWFPRKLSDLDTFADKVLSYGVELDSDHPGFTDGEYRKRREQITLAALKHRHGMELPLVDYTEDEVKTWGIVYNRLRELYKSHACYEHQYIFPLLEQNCGYGPDKIPQIRDISRFLKDCTGWTVRPVMGLLSPRDFLNALAFRVFHSTQYIRHHSSPLYTPEPDVCHELLGHVPLFADPDFASFSQEIGLASLGASDEDLSKLSTIYWFTVEFGLCRQGKDIKAYGAGLLSSFGELEYCTSDKPKLLPFNCEVMGVQEYPITTYQPVYFVADSFKQMKDDVREYSLSLKRPFGVNYNALTQTIEVLDTRDKVMRFASAIRGDMTRLMNAIDKIVKE